MRLDRFDVRLLALLQSDADATQDELAEAARLSRSQCSRRLQRLREEGLIERTVALLSPERLGLTLKAYVTVSLRSHSPEDLALFSEMLAGAPEVLECSMMTGDADYLMKVQTADLPRFDLFLQRFLACAAVTRVRSSIVLRDVKRTTQLPLPEPSAQDHG